MSLPAPNYTQVPNFIIDEKMADLSPAEFKVIMLILRYTSGFHRREASISFSHFEEKCGVSKKWVRESCKKMESLGWIKVVHGDEKTANIYRILLSQEVGNSVPQGGELSTSGVGNSVPPIKKEIKKDKENNNASPSESAAPVVVSPFFLNRGIGKTLGAKLTKKYSEAQIKQACDAVSEMIGCYNVEASIQAALTEGWEPKKSKEDVVEENKSYLKKVMQYDSAKFGPYTAEVSLAYFLFRHSRVDGTRDVCFKVEDVGMIKDIKAMIIKNALRYR